MDRNMESFSRQKYENIPLEVEPDFEKLRKDKKRAAEIIDKFVTDKRDPNLIEGLRTLYYGLKLRARAETIKERLDSRRQEFKDAAFDEALRIEEKHFELQQHVIDAVEELQRFEREELGRNRGAEERSGPDG